MPQPVSLDRRSLAFPVRTERRAGADVAFREGRADGLLRDRPEI
jgi:hypothetical protein